MSDDTLGGGGWGFDRGHLSQLQLDRARETLEAGDPARALAEAEELLDSQPDDAVALAVVGRAALVLGDGATAAAALQAVARALPDDAEVWAELARARFSSADWDGALTAVGQVLAISAPADAAVATACFVRGQITLRSALSPAPAPLPSPGSPPGDPQADLARAAALDPARYPLAHPLSDARWRTCLQRALLAVSEPVQAFLEGVPLAEQAWPTLERLQAGLPLATPEVGALAQGEPPAVDPWITRPETITLFRENLCWPPASGEIISQRIAQALTNVAVAWTDEDLDEETEDAEEIGDAG